MKKLEGKIDMVDKTIGDLLRERYIVIKPECFSHIDFESDKCGECPVVGQCFEASESNKKE